MMMDSLSAALGLLFIGVGLAFDLFGCIGLVRFPDVYNRLQGATN
jgi:multicomponent Na+:H+ antiporter subunit G